MRRYPWLGDWPPLSFFWFSIFRPSALLSPIASFLIVQRVLRRELAEARGETFDSEDEDVDDAGSKEGSEGAESEIPAWRLSWPSSRPDATATITLSGPPAPKTAVLPTRRITLVTSPHRRPPSPRKGRKQRPGGNPRLLMSTVDCGGDLGLPKWGPGAASAAVAAVLVALCGSSASNRR